MIDKLKKKLESIFDDYLESYTAAGTRTEWAGNFLLDTKKEIRKKMLLDIGAVIELGRLHGISTKKLNIGKKTMKDVEKAQKEDSSDDVLDNIDLDNSTID